MPAGCSWDLGRERRKVHAPRRAITRAGEDAGRGLPAHALVEFILRFGMDGIEFARLVEQFPGRGVSKAANVHWTFAPCSPMRRVLHDGHPPLALHEKPIG